MGAHTAGAREQLIVKPYGKFRTDKEIGTVATASRKFDPLSGQHFDKEAK